MSPKRTAPDRIIFLLVLLSVGAHLPSPAYAEMTCHAIFETKPNSVAESIATFQKAFDQYMEHRLSSLPLEKRDQIREILGRIHFQKDLDNAHYDQLTKSVLFDEVMTKDLIIHYDILAHEIEHAIQVVEKARVALILGHVVRLFNPLPVITANTRKIESEAIGAEWDFLQTLSPLERAKGLEKVKLIDGLKPEFKKLLEDTIAVAHLPREEFVRKVTDRSGYSYRRLLTSEYAIKGILYGLIAFAAASSLDDD